MESEADSEDKGWGTVTVTMTMWQVAELWRMMGQSMPTIPAAVAPAPMPVPPTAVAPPRAAVAPMAQSLIVPKYDGPLIDRAGVARTAEAAAQEALTFTLMTLPLPLTLM